MLITALLEFLWEIIVAAVKTAVLGFFVTIAVILAGEKFGWW